MAYRSARRRTIGLGGMKADRTEPCGTHRDRRPRMMRAGLDRAVPVAGVHRRRPLLTWSETRGPVYFRPPSAIWKVRTLEFRGLVDVLRRRYLLIVIAFVATSVIAAVVSAALPKTYEARAILLIGNATGSVTPSLDQALLSQRLSITYADVATQRATLQRVIDKLQLNSTTENLTNRVTAKTATESSIVRISVQDTDPKQAATIANAIAADLINSTPAITGANPDSRAFIDQSLVETRTQIDETQAEINVLADAAQRTPAQETMLASLQTRLANLRSSFATLLTLSSSATANLATVSDPAVPPTHPISPNIPLNLILAAVAGLLLGAAAAFAVDHVDDTVRGAADIERLSGASALAMIGAMPLNPKGPKIYWLSSLLRPHTAVAEAFRTLRTNIEFSTIHREVQTLLVTSPMPGDGKTTVAANLAVVFAQAGRQTILVDADMRRPTIQEVFGITAPTGLTSVRHWDEGTLNALLVATEEPNLRILPCGFPPPNPVELMRSAWMDRLIEMLRATGSLIIFDSAPLQLIADATILASKVDATLVVVRVARTRHEGLTRALEALRLAGAYVVGVTANGVTADRREIYPSYYEVDKGEAGGTGDHGAAAPKAAS